MPSFYFSLNWLLVAHILDFSDSSMLGTYSDEFGKLDFERSQHGSGMSNRSQAKRFVSALHGVAERTYSNLFEFQQLRQIAKEINIQVSQTKSVL